MKYELFIEQYNLKFQFIGNYKTKLILIQLIGYQFIN